MYGMVNQGVKDLVVSKFGPDKWHEIRTKAGVEFDDFVFMQMYPDKLTYDLIGAATVVLNLDAAIILEEFGKFWVEFTANQGYGQIMDLFGSDFVSAIKNLNNLHARMGVTMPQLTPPRFEIKEIGQKVFEVSYFSKRPGLSPMFVGLMKGLATKHNAKIRVENISRAEGAAQCVLKVTME